MSLRAALFDMDGTVWSSPVDWREVRRAIGLPYDGRPIAAHLEVMPAVERSRGTAILEHYEAVGVEQGEPMPGASGLLALLQGAGVQCLLITNNSRRSAEEVLRRHPLPFDRVFTRDDGVLKPAGEALARPLRELGIRPTEALAVGDSHLDLVAAHDAGIEEIVLIATAERAHDLEALGIPFRAARDLSEATAMVANLLTRERPSSDRRRRERPA